MEQPFTPGKKLAHYSVVSALGAGGMGVVYRARDEKLGRDVALKVLPAGQAADAAARARMLREAQTASALNHPHICHIYEIGAADERDYIAMELVEGKPLSACIPPGGLPTDMVLRYGEQMADALEHAHSRNVLHRDIKSSNVVLTPAGHAKILDFGLAKRVSGDISEAATLSQVSPLTQAGTIAGTLSYLAPEVLSGHPADARSDLWALGVVLYEMATGTLPFQGRTSFEATAAILREAAKPMPPNVPPGLRGVIQRCLAKEPGQRYQRAGEVRAALEAIGSGQHAAVEPAGPVASQPQERRSPWTPWILAGVALLVAVCLLWSHSFWDNSGQRQSQDLAASSGPGTPSQGAGPGGARGLTGGGKPSAVAEANEYYEKAILFIGPQFDPLRARDLLERALVLDPKFAEARSKHSLTLMILVDSGFSNDAASIYKAEQEARRALQDDPQCASAYGALSFAYAYQGKTVEGIRTVDEGLRLEPQNFSLLAGKAMAEALRGNFDVSIEHTRRAIQIVPTFGGARWNLGRMLHQTGDRAGAEREFHKLLEVDPTVQAALLYLAHMRIETGDLQGAQAFLGRLRAESRRNYRTRMMHALLFAAQGKTKEAKSEMDAEVLKFAEIVPTATLEAAEFYALLGDSQQALSWLERAVRNGDERVQWFKANPLLAKVREQPRFQQIVDSIAFRRRQE